MEGTTSTSFGSRKSMRLVRIYRKNEDGKEVTRLEYQLRRPALRAIGVTSMESFSAAPWDEILSRAVRFRRFSPPADAVCQDVPLEWDTHVIRLAGLHAALQCDPKRRRTLVKHLKPHPIGDTVLSLVRSAVVAAVGQQARR